MNTKGFYLKQIGFYLLWISFAICFVACYYNQISVLDEFIENTIIATWLSNLKDSIDSSYIVRISLVIASLVYIAISIYKASKVRTLSFKRLILCVITSSCVLVTCLCDEKWHFADLVCKITFGHFFGVLAAIVAVANIIIYIAALVSNYQKRGPRKHEDSNPKCLIKFTADAIDDTLISSSINAYAKEIARRIDNSETSKEAFSVGIAGSWGTGKTTFLNALKKVLGNELYVMEFSPWNCKTPELINDDFFTRFRDVLTINVDPNLDKPITDYARHLNTINRLEPWWAFARNLLLAYSESDLDTLKARIADSLRNSKTKIAVLIDDIDRLDKNELFEVLRLVRNTANLPNVLFFVTYDKEYVVDLLEKKGISSPSLYLEKIFNVEVMLPKVTKTDLISVLIDDLKEMADESDVLIIDQIVNDIKRPNVVHLLLSNYREVKRFARQFALHLSFAKDNLKSVNIDIEDLFWIELVRYADFDVYSILRDEPSKIIKSSIFNSSSVANLQDSVKQELSDDYQGVPRFNKYVIKVLNYLFDISRPRSANSIVYLQNYNRYFTLGVEKSKVYQHEVDALLELDEKSLVETVHNWLKGNTGIQKDLRSLLFHIYQINMSSLPLNKWKNVFNILTAALSCNCDNSLINRALYAKLCEDDSPICDLEEKRVWLFNMLKDMIEKVDNYSYFSGVCKNAKISNSILTNEQWEELMCLNCRKFLNDKNPDAIEILNTNSLLYRLWKDGIVSYYVEDDFGQSYYEPSTNIIFNEVKSYFDNKRSKEYKRFDDFFSSGLTDEELFQGVDAQEKVEISQNRISEYFTDYYLMADYRDACFSDKAKSPNTKTSAQEYDSKEKKKELPQTEEPKKQKSNTNKAPKTTKPKRGQKKKHGGKRRG